ncbi:MAG: rhodanese-like domain-containing protein [Conexibacteraceae bacterium]|nr:rhodanese-like domain-containing protein [Conexibacteraceae bacterium]
MSDDYTPKQVAELLAAGGVQLIDVRAAHEHEAGHITGSRLIELQNLAAEAATIDRDVPVILYCKSGSRSAMATDALLQAGFDAHNMAGGFSAWHSAGLEMEPADGYVADA